jgi:hypothetical protein
MNSATKSVSVWALALACLVWFPGASYASNDEKGALKLKAQLIWGTNSESSPDPKHREVDAALKKRLQAVFKWKSYFEVNQQTFTVGPKKTRRIKLSPQCEVEVTNLGGNQIESKLFGEGEFQLRKRQTLKPGEIFSLAGHAKNGTAWFVIFTPVDK